MPQITIVGLGPGDAGDLTRDAWQVLQEAGEVWLRTLHHPVVADLPAGLTLHAFDEVYERSDRFSEVYGEIVQQILTLSRREQGVVYAVPGHPLVGESTVTRLLAVAREDKVPVRIVGGLSFVEPALTALGLDALDGLQIIDALDLLSLNHPPLNPDQPALIAQVYSRAVASEVKLVLMNQYDDEHPTALIDGAGTQSERVQHLPLYEIDRQVASPLTTLYVAPLEGVASFEGFQGTIAKLRAPDGCPWDREQTHETLRTNLLEECYEVLEAIDEGSPEALSEELGDLLLQVVLHAQIAVEDGEFRMTDVISHIDAKLKRRHPHVWAGVDVSGVGDVVANWEVIKQQERAAKGAGERSLLDGIPRALPALAQAVAYSDRAARVGFDRIEGDGVWGDLPETVAADLARLLAVLEAHLASEGHASLMGDVLLVISDWARRQHIDPESALRGANQRFAQRFSMLETAARERGVALDDLSPEDIHRLWESHGVS
ncbi:MAG: nucleoside triphosphate pyrophosphohydrolase [Anaerolineae bacterium]|nr:nucleoside triphosphate pyrophosphohydrolase [Anaerolineae bacterium]